MTIAKRIIDYYTTIDRPTILPNGIELLYPFNQDKVIQVMTQFYHEYYNDNKSRTLLIGINPGRLGGGVTGIPFTDPKHLEYSCGIKNSFDKKPELSSTFIYEMINHLGGPAKFYSKYLITSVCPLGFIKEGKNINYYDDKMLQENLEQYMVENLRWHTELVGNNKIAYSLGQGKNIKYLEFLNDKYQLFERIEALPHPRWILQYRRKQLPDFLELYRQKLSN